MKELMRSTVTSFFKPLNIRFGAESTAAKIIDDIPHTRGIENKNELILVLAQALEATIDYKVYQNWGTSLLDKILYDARVRPMTLQDQFRQTIANAIHTTSGKEPINADVDSIKAIIQKALEEEPGFSSMNQLLKRDNLTHHV